MKIPPKPPVNCSRCGKEMAYAIIILTLPTGTKLFCSLTCFDKDREEDPNG